MNDYIYLQPDMWKDIFTFLQARSYLKKETQIAFYLKMAIRKMPPNPTKNVISFVDRWQRHRASLPPSLLCWCVMCIHGRKRSFPLDACGY